MRRRPPPLSPLQPARLQRTPALPGFGVSGHAKSSGFELSGLTSENWSVGSGGPDQAALAGCGVESTALFERVQTHPLALQGWVALGNRDAESPARFERVQIFPLSTQGQFALASCGEFSAPFERVQMWPFHEPRRSTMPTTQ